MIGSKFPSYKTIAILYGRNAYSNMDIRRFVQLGALTEEEYYEMTGEQYEFSNPEDSDQEDKS